MLTRPRQRVCPALLALAAVLAPAGCQTKARLSSANDDLRIQRETLRERVDELELANAELRSKLAETARAEETALPSDVIDALPRVGEIRITRFSGVVKNAGNASARVFLSPVDGRGRFVQAVGSVEIRVIGTGETGDEPSLLAEHIAGPSQLRDAYVVGLSGPSYRFDLPLLAEPTAGAAVRVVLNDLLTGMPHEAEAILAIEPAAASEP